MPPIVMAALTAFASAIGRVTLALLKFSGALAGMTARGAVGAARAIGGVPAYAGRELSNNNFLQRRVSWAAYHMATGGLEAMGVGAVRAFQNVGASNWDTLGSRAVTTSVLQQLNDKLGINLGQVAQQTAAATSTADMTSQIARVGGIVTPELREAYYAQRLRGEKAAYAERQEVQKLLEAQYSSETKSFNEDTLSGGEQAILNQLTKIYNALRDSR